MYRSGKARLGQKSDSHKELLGKKHSDAHQKVGAKSNWGVYWTNTARSQDMKGGVPSQSQLQAAKPKNYARNKTKSGYPLGLQRPSGGANTRFS